MTATVNQEHRHHRATKHMTDDDKAALAAARERKLAEACEIAKRQVYHNCPTCGTATNLKSLCGKCLWAAEQKQKAGESCQPIK